MFHEFEFDFEARAVSIDEGPFLSIPRNWDDKDYRYVRGGEAFKEACECFWLHESGELSFSLA